MKIHHYGKSWFANRWTTWRRWWRHPDRELARRQFRRGIRFWFRWPWNAVLVSSIVLDCVSIVVPDQDQLTVVTAVFGMFGIFVVLLNYIAWMNCLLDDGMNYFRGSRLGELLVTPSGPRRLFPALLMAPLGVWGLLQVISAAFSMVAIFLSPFSSLVKLSGSSILGALNDHHVLKCAHLFVQTLLGFVSSMALMAGVTARIAAWSIGDQRSTGIAKSVFGFLGILILVGVITGAASLVAALFLGAAATIPITYATSIMITGIGLLFWRMGLKKLRSAETLAKLRQLMESAK